LENIVTPSENELISEEAKTPLQKVGAFIKEGRKARSISIEDLSNSLRIGKEQLEALENGQEDFLPEKVFIKAMVRRISDKLGLDTDFIIKELEGRDVLINKLYERKNSADNKILYKNLIPLMIILSGLLGLISSIPTIEYIKDLNQSQTRES
tara:strand:- start:200 stop:658 length:459 start_codon:yes stop_codon:yes gene_type:complete